jgi:transcription-repair coupling factor (superfamily II helicase)
MPVDVSAVPTRLTDLPAILGEPAAARTLLAALASGRSGTIDGAWGSSAALATALLVQHAPTTVLVVVAHPGTLDPWADDLTSFVGQRPTWFPAAEERADQQLVFDTSAGQRLRVVQRLRTGPPRVVLAPFAALLQSVPAPAELTRRSRELRVGASVAPDELARWLIDHGCKRVEAVEYPNEFARRGGIFDLYSPDADHPCRLEFFGDDIESIRKFAAQSQRSLGMLTEFVFLAARDPQPTPDRGHLCDYLPPGAWVVLIEPEELREQGRQFLEHQEQTAGLYSVNGAFAQVLKLPSVTVTALPSPSLEASYHLQVESVERFSGNINHLRDELDGIAAAATVLIGCATDAECRRLGDVLAAGQLAQSHRLKLLTGAVHAGFRLVEPNVVVLGSHELFHRDAPPVGPVGGDAPKQPRRRVESRAIDSFLDLKPGDYVVHVAQGIAIYRGMAMLTKGTTTPVADDGLDSPAREEHLILEFRDGALLYVPVSKIDLVQKYVGGSQSQPELSKIGGLSWGRKKEKVAAAVLDLASEMIDLQAVRAAQPGVAFPPDSDWQREFEAAFPYRETPDQLTALSELKADLERARPMDRLICGDVGYGKTEVAIRAAFKAVDNGRQVAVLVPTTVLAEQHFRTFSQRFEQYPFVVECLSRFRTAAEQRRIIKSIREGGVDVVIGTHRLCSADVQFKDLGLAIIDEEQRFGVEHKERLKKLRALVDVLTLTATPIPRTLHSALLGIRDISNLETPPADRLPIETRIVRFDEALIKHAIHRELNREGQVYFVHNRVHDIQHIADRVQHIVPHARIAIAHGQMDERNLEQAMVRFLKRDAQILLATTIIESGLDIPNANTIFINEADHYGLADLHQLRGRVGRHKNRAYAYLLVDGHKTVSSTAARRLKAIEEFTELGAGFKIAMRDLEIRGAGNLLGTQQSGHIAAVGYEMYCQLLENAVRGLQKLPLNTPLEVTVDLPWPAYLPRDYVPGQKLRIEVYRRLARVRDLPSLQDFRQELRDRYGTPPESAEWLLRTAEIRILLAQWHIASVHRDGPDVVLTYRDRIGAHALAQLSQGVLRVVDEKCLYLRPTEKQDSPQGLYEVLRQVLKQ